MGRARFSNPWKFQVPFFQALEKGKRGIGGTEKGNDE